jgi:serine protease Do
MNTRTKHITGTIAAPAVLLIALAVYLMLSNPLRGETPVGSSPPVDFKSAIAWVAQKNIPAVVHIEVAERQVVSNPFLPFENDPFFRHFFDTPKMPKKFKRELRGLGTGMLIDAAGHILTNNHVVDGATTINVLLANGQRYPAKRVGTDPKTDLAVIKIAAHEQLPYVHFGDSDTLQVGDWVVAIGHPSGLDQTVTQGIISAKHRQGIMDPTNYQDFLQTDAAINPGNSGGPLINLQGDVIGVNAAIVSESGGFEGLGFAIPSNMALHIAKALIEHGKIERGWLGVSVQDLTPDLAKSFNIEQSKGALVSDVVKGGPAEAAGLMRGDVIVAYDGKAVEDAGTLRNRVAITPIGKAVPLTAVRNGEKKECTVTIGDLRDEVKKLAVSLKDRLGAEVRAPIQKEIEKYGLDKTQGVVITWLKANGPLAAAGFEVGDMILEINNQPISGVDSFVSVVSVLPPNQRITVLGLDHNTGNTGYIEVKIQ